MEVQHHKEGLPALQLEVGFPQEVWDNVGDSTLGKCLDGDGGAWRGWLLPSAFLCRSTHPGAHRTRKTVTFQGAIQSLSLRLLRRVLLPSICLLFCLFLSFHFLPTVLLCGWMAAETVQFHLVVISGKFFLTGRSSEGADFVPGPFPEMCAFPCTLLCWLYTSLAPQETGRNIVLVSRHFAMSPALGATHLKFNSKKNEDLCRMDDATQRRVLVIFHLKYDLQYDLIIIFLFSSLCPRFHIHITAPFNSCLLRQLSFGLRVRNSADLLLWKTTVKRKLQFFSLGSFS